MGKSLQIKLCRHSWDKLSCFTESVYVYPHLRFGGPKKGVCCVAFTFSLFFKVEDLKCIFHLYRIFRCVRRLIWGNCWGSRRKTVRKVEILEITIFYITEFGSWRMGMMETKRGFGNKQGFTVIIMKTLLRWNKLSTLGGVLLHEGYC